MKFEESSLQPSRVSARFTRGTVYDLNLAILTHCGWGNLTRVDCMKTLGVVNPGNLKIHLTLLVNPGDFDFLDRLRSGWQATAEVTVLEMPSAHPVPKINGYYLWLMQHGPAARWHGRVDDDSMTDLARAVRFLDRTYGAEPVHAATGPVTPQEHEPLFVPYLLEQGIYLDAVHTEWESSFTNAAGMQRIFSHPAARALIVESGLLFTAPGDRALAFAAHVAGVPVVENPESCWHFEPARFSLCGGDLHHIHYVPWHQAPLVAAIAAFLTAPESPLSAEEVASLCGLQAYFHTSPQEHQVVALCPDGRIVNEARPEVSHWHFSAGGLHFHAHAHAGPDEAVAVFTTAACREGERILHGRSTGTGESVVLRYLPGSWR